MTIGQVHNFDVNDEFHYSKSAPNTTPSSLRHKIIGKSFSATNDTVFYYRLNNNYTTQFNGTPPLIYFHTSYIDTVYHTNLQTLYDSAYINWPVNIQAGTWFNDTLYYDNNQCGQLVYQYETCHRCIFEGTYHSVTVGMGLGLVSATVSVPGPGPGSFSVNLRYYKKGAFTCGIPDTNAAPISTSDITSSLNSLSIFPNPVTDILTIDCAGHNDLGITIFNLVGEVVIHSSLTSGINKLNVAPLPRGLYVARVINGYGSIQKKLMLK